MNEPTNSDRAERGDYIIGAYIAKYGGDGESVIQDIISDLMHSNHRSEDCIDFDAAITVATVNFNCEISEERE